MSGCGDVSTCAQFLRPVAADRHNTHFGTVLFTEQRHSSGLQSLFDWHHFIRHSQIIRQPIVDQGFNVINLTGFQRTVVAEVEAQT